MYRKILVLLDGSTRAETILPHVKHLAKLGGSTVILLQVVEPSACQVTHSIAYHNRGNPPFPIFRQHKGVVNHGTPVWQ